MCGWQGQSFAEQGPRLNARAEAEQLAQCFRIDLTREPPTRQHRFELGSENQGPARLGVEERLDPKMIACQQQLFPSGSTAPVVKRDREDAAKSGQKPLTILLVER